MRSFVTLCLLLISCQVALAQQDLYKWQLSGYTGIANYINEENTTPDYFKTNHNLLHRVELTRKLGYTFGLSAGYSFGQVRGDIQQPNPFTTDVRLSALRAYFYSDNGWLLNTSAWVAPYVFGGYGLGILKTSNGTLSEESRYVPAIPFGMGLKFRIAERWQVAVQTEAVYLTETHLRGAAIEQNAYNNAFLHTGITVGYSFGFRQSTFKAPRFYAGNLAMLQTVEAPKQPRQNLLEMMLKLEPKEVQVISTPNAETPATQPEIANRTVSVPADTRTTTSTVVETDTSSALAQIRRHRLVPAEPAQVRDTTTGGIQTISSASTMIDLDSVVDRNAIREVPPAPAAKQRVERTTRTRAVQNQPVMVKEQRVVQTQDSVITITTITTTERVPVARQEPAPARMQERAVARTREAAAARTEQRAPARAQKAAPARASETTRVVERPVYVPTESRPARVQIQNSGADAAQLREERLRLNAVNAQNRRLQSRIDSLQAVPQTAGDTLGTGTVAAVDTSMVQYLQQQAALNDSMLQRLNQYEQELALLKQANAAPVLTPVVAPAPAAPAPVAPARANTTTVFYPISVHTVPAASLRDLNQVLKTLQDNPGMTVKLTGYSSQSGNAAYNLALSRKRVASLESFLTEQGISKERIRTKYVGDAASSQKENPLDRKVEIELID